MKHINFYTPVSLPQQQVSELRLTGASINFETRSGFAYLACGGAQPVRVPLPAEVIEWVESVVADAAAAHDVVPSGGVVEDVPEPTPAPVHAHTPEPTRGEAVRD